MKAKFRSGDQVLVLSRNRERAIVNYVVYIGFDQSYSYVLNIEDEPYSITVSQDDLEAADEPEPLPLPPFSYYVLSMLDLYIDMWKSDLDKLYKIQKLMRYPHDIDSEIETLKNCIKNIEWVVNNANGRCKFCALQHEFGHLDFCPEKDK